MIPSSTPGAIQSASQGLQNALPADLSATKQTQIAETMISQRAVDEFALRFNAAMIAMLAAQGAPAASPLSKKLRVYATAGIVPVRPKSRFA